MQFRSIGTHFRYRRDISIDLRATKRHKVASVRYPWISRIESMVKIVGAFENRDVAEMKFSSFFFSSFVTGIQAIGDYRSNTLTRGIPVYTSAKSRRIRRWLKRSTSSSRVSGSFEIVSVINRHCFAFEFSSSGSIRCSLKSY